MVEKRTITFKQDDIIEALEAYYNLKKEKRAKFYNNYIIVDSVSNALP